MDVKSNLKQILDDRGIPIRRFAAIAGLPYESVRRLYHDDTRRYQRETIARVCEVLEIDISDLLELVDEPAGK